MIRSSRYSPEVRERMVRMMLEHEREYDFKWSAIVSIASKIGNIPPLGLRSYTIRTRRIRA